MHFYKHDTKSALGENLSIVFPKTATKDNIEYPYLNKFIITSTYSNVEHLKPQEHQDSVC